MTSEWAPPGHDDPWVDDELKALRMTDPNAARRREISLIQEAVDRLPSDDFAARFALQSRADRIRAALHEDLADELDAANDDWAERAGRKGEHAQNVDALEAMARSMIGESGGLA